VLKPLIDGQPVSVIDRDGTVVAIDPNPADRLRAVKIALKYGPGTEWTDADQATPPQP
jgi:YD repeat-containing protein